MQYRAIFEGESFYIVNFPFVLSKIRRLARQGKDPSRNDIINMRYYWGPDWLDLIFPEDKHGNVCNQPK